MGGNTIKAVVGNVLALIHKNKLIQNRGVDISMDVLFCIECGSTNRPAASQIYRR